MDIKMPYNWDISLIHRLSVLNKSEDTKYPIRELYAADRAWVFGNGRPPNAVQGRRGELGDHISEAHQAGMRFCYVLNACSLAGQEWEQEGQERIFEKVAEFVLAGGDSLIITIPFIAVLVKRWFPSITITSSVNNQLTSAEKASQLFASAPFDEIQIPFTHARDFPLFRAMRKAFPERRIINLVNESCLPDCAFQRFHQDFYNFLRPDDKKIDFYHLSCAIHKLTNPINVLKSQWIRPEDLSLLEQNGITCIKLAGREKKESQWLMDMAKCYTSGRSMDNIFCFVEKTGLLDVEWSSILGRKLSPCHYHVDGNALNGFIEPFVSGSIPCVAQRMCHPECEWCSSYMHAVSPPRNAKSRLNDVKQLMDILLSSYPDMDSIHPKI